MGTKLRSGPLKFGTDMSGFEENPNGELVLFLHGFPDNRQTFRFQLPAFAEAGYRAVAASLRGYEPSSIPDDGDYSVMTLALDVVAMIDELGADRVHLVGHDWGAVVAYAVAAHSPERVHSLSAIAIPHPPRIPVALRRVPSQVLKSWYMTFFQLRVISDRALRWRDWALLRRLWRKWSPAHRMTDAEWEQLRTGFEQPGVEAAMLAYYRQNASPLVLAGLRSSASMKLTTVPVRTLAITGTDDGCMDTRLFDHAFLDGDFPNGHRIRRMEGAGHFLHLEKPEETNGLLLEWIGSA